MKRNATKHYLARFVIRSSDQKFAIRRKGHLADGAYVRADSERRPAYVRLPYSNCVIYGR